MSYSRQICPLSLGSVPLPLVTRAIGRRGASGAVAAARVAARREKAAGPPALLVPNEGARQAERPSPAPFDPAVGALPLESAARGPAPADQALEPSQNKPTSNWPRERPIRPSTKQTSVSLLAERKCETDGPAGPAGVYDRRPRQTRAIARRSPARMHVSFSRDRWCGKTSKGESGEFRVRWFPRGAR